MGIYEDIARAIRRRFRLGAIGVGLCLVSPAVAEHDKGSVSFIALEPMFLDSEGGQFCVTDVGLSRPPSSFLDIYTAEGKVFHSGVIAPIVLDSDDPPGTFYAYRIGVDLMDGPALGYNHMGNGAFFLPTVPIPASQTPELTWLFFDSPGYNGFLDGIAQHIFDRLDRPSIALAQSRTGVVVGRAPYHILAEYGPGNQRPGSDLVSFNPGVIQDLATVFWGAPTNLESHQVQLGFPVPVGPLNVSFAPDGYTTVTLALDGAVNRAVSSSIALTATTGLSASGYLAERGITPLPPPKWILLMALKEKLSGKTKWLYPPLDRYADVNGDGVLDAADLALANQQ
ncbi:hypothetical protein BH09SUM1_BH09SUM1_02330 [soil metagenome]